MKAALALLVCLAATAAADKRESRAFIFVIDRSASRPLETTKEMVSGGIQAARGSDTIAVIGFARSAKVFVPPKRAVRRRRIFEELRRMRGGFGVNLFAGLTEAFEIAKRIRSTKRHIIVITGSPSPEDGILDLVMDIRTQNITISTIGMRDADRSLLAKIAAGADGETYMIDDLSTLPKIVAKEVQGDL